MSQYKMIAFDMDGTLLNSQKKISPKTLEAIEKATQAGKTVVLNTGRCPAELDEYLELLPHVRYLNCVSGGLVFDREEGRVLSSIVLSEETVGRVLAIGSEEDIMPHILTELSIVQRDKIAQMDKYHVGIYREMFERVTTQWEDLVADYARAPFPVAKLNLYHATAEGRERTRTRLLEAGLDVELVRSEGASLEVSAKGVHKGIGLECLCQTLGYSMEEVIVVGDGENDATALSAAGLSVAMANATENIKRLADVITADNDHDGCVQVIEQYLL